MLRLVYCVVGLGWGVCVSVVCVLAVVLGLWLCICFAGCLLRLIVDLGWLFHDLLCCVDGIVCWWWVWFIGLCWWWVSAGFRVACGLLEVLVGVFGFDVVFARVLT